MLWVVAALGLGVRAGLFLDVFQKQVELIGGWLFGQVQVVGAQATGADVPNVQAVVGLCVGRHEVVHGVQGVVFWLAGQTLFVAFWQWRLKRHQPRPCAGFHGIGQLGVDGD